MFKSKILSMYINPIMYIYSSQHKYLFNLSIYYNIDIFGMVFESNIDIVIVE